MRAILIDPFEKTLSEVEHSGDYKEIYELISCGTRPFTIIQIDPDNVIYLDDEGLYQPEQKFFRFGQYPSPLAGKGLILGVNREGESCTCTVPLDIAKGLTSFPSVRFAGVESREYQAIHRHLGPITVIESRAQFVDEKDIN